MLLIPLGGGGFGGGGFGWGGFGGNGGPPNWNSNPNWWYSGKKRKRNRLQLEGEDDNENEELSEPSNSRETNQRIKKLMLSCILHIYFLNLSESLCV